MQWRDFVNVKCATQRICKAYSLETLQLLRSTQICRVGDHPLVRLALHPPLEGCLQLGATIAGTLDFRFSQEAAQQSGAAPKCVQVVVMLETEEVVQDRWQAPSKRQTGPVRKVGSDVIPCMCCSCMLVIAVELELVGLCDRCGIRSERLCHGLMQCLCMYMSDNYVCICVCVCVCVSRSLMAVTLYRCMMSIRN